MDRDRIQQSVESERLPDCGYTAKPRRPASAERWSKRGNCTDHGSEPARWIGLRGGWNNLYIDAGFPMGSRSESYDCGNEQSAVERDGDPKSVHQLVRWWSRIAFDHGALVDDDLHG